MTCVLVSRTIAEAYGPRIRDIFDRFGRPLDLVAFALDAPPRPEASRALEIAFYSRDVWEGCDKTIVNPQTSAFFALTAAAIRPALRSIG